MVVKLSPELEERIHQLMRSAGYRSPEAVLEAALDALEAPICDTDAWSPDTDGLDAHADADIEAGRTRVVDGTYLAELRARAEAIIAGNQRRR